MAYVKYANVIVISLNIFHQNNKRSFPLAITV